MCTSVLAN